MWDVGYNPPYLACSIRLRSYPARGSFHRTISDIRDHREESSPSPGLLTTARVRMLLGKLSVWQNTPSDSPKCSAYASHASEATWLSHHSGDSPLATNCQLSSSALSEAPPLWAVSLFCETALPPSQCLPSECHDYSHSMDGPPAKQDITQFSCMENFGLM